MIDASTLPGVSPEALRAITNNDVPATAGPIRRSMLQVEQAPASGGAVQPNPDRTYVGQQRVRVYVAQPRAR